jgi:trimeric autotransporter adhesin
VREIKLGASTLTLSSGVTFTTSTNLTFDAGTSSIVVDAGSINGGGQTFYDVSFTSTSDGTSSILQSNTFNSLSITAPASANLRQVAFSGDQTITGTLTVAGASVTRRIFLRSSVVGTPRTLTVGTLSANDCDFRDITIAGTAAGTSPTRAGDCGGNSGVNFPAPKTVYWNLAGSRNWSSTAWATSSGGTPALNNFPLAQDTAVFDDTGAAGTVTINTTHNAGTIDMSARTSAMTFSPSATFNVYGSWTFGTGVTSGGSANLTALTFLGRGTSTITSNGITFNHPITIDCGTGTVQLADALEFTSTRTLTLTSGTFDAVSYNVTAGKFGGAGSGVYALRMGSGTWTLSGTGFIFSINSSNGVLYKGTADILLSDTGTSDRIISGLAQSFNKLTIGGATGISTLTISGSHQFTELASTKTVAHTIALGTTTQTFGKWSVTGTAGNVVTLTGTGTSHILAGSCTSGIDYLAIGSIRFAATSPAEFYAGANSTATGSPAAPTYLTDKPADSTRYWVGGTGNWNDTNRWSTSSGGAGGADLPRSHDDVVFDSLSAMLRPTRPL